jgi:hypothetical protein
METERNDVEGKKVKVDDTQVRRNFLVAHRLQETFLMTYR